MLSVLDAKYKNNYVITVNFSDDKVGDVDLRDFIFSGKIKPFKELQDVAKFKNFKIDYTLKWGDELDLAPEYLYFKAFEENIEMQELFQRWGYK